MPSSFDLFNELVEKSHNVDLAQNAADSYAELNRMVDIALSQSTEAERDDYIKTIYQNTVNQAAKSALIHRGIMSWSDDMYEKYNDNTFRTALSTSGHVEQLLKEIIKEKGSDYVCKENMGLFNEEYIDYIGKLATSVKMKDVQNEFFKQSTIESCENAMGKYANELLDDSKEIKYSGNFANPAERQVSEVYALYENAWDNIKKAGFFGNLFHPINFFKNVGLIRTANSIFKKVGFNAKTDGPDAKGAFETTADECAGSDLAYLSEMESSFKEDAKLSKYKDLKETRVARDKLENTLAAIKNGTMEHPMHKINAMLAKYGQSVTENKDYRPGRVEGISVFNEELVAEEYDKTQEIKPLQDYIKGIFYKGLNQMMSASIKSGNPMNISEIMKDASDITVIMAKEYTPLYEHAELKDLAENSAFGSYDTEKIFGYVKQILDNNNVTDKYDLEALKNEIEQTVKEYKNPTLEDYKAKEAMETVNDNTKPTVTEEPLIEKISVDLSYGNNPQIEETQPPITEQAVTKEREQALM